MQGADQGAPRKPLDGGGLRIAIVQARFNEPITDALASACLAELAALGVPAAQCVHLTVPGALEVPAALQALAEQNRFDVLIANAILTTENLEQAVARQTDKGRDAARVAVEMANLLGELK